MGGGQITSFFRVALEFIALMFLLGRGAVVYKSIPRFISLLIGYAGIGRNHILFIDRLKQYSEFLYYSFFSPCAGFHSHAGLNMEEFNSWQLYRIESVNYTGLAILALALFSAFINRKSKICRVSFMWVILSFIVLCAIGWGTAENGLILYSLYFSWAFYILIFMLVLKAEELSGIKILAPLLVVAALCVFVRVSFPAINELVDFAVKYYPCSW